MKKSEFNKLVDELIDLCFEVSCGDYYCDRVLEFDDVVELLESKLNDNWISCSKSMPEDILTYNKNTSQPAINVLVFRVITKYCSRIVISDILSSNFQNQITCH